MSSPFLQFLKKVLQKHWQSHLNVILYIRFTHIHYMHLCVFYVFDFYMQEYRSGHNEAVLKTSFVCLCNFLKTLDFIGFFASSDALCEKRFSQFSRNFPWLGLRFLIKLNTRRVIEVVITRRSWNVWPISDAPKPKSLDVPDFLPTVSWKKFLASKGTSKAKKLVETPQKH